MSAAEKLFLQWEIQDLRQPDFTRVFKGFDPGEVEEYLTRLVDRLQSLEDSLARTRHERDAALVSAARAKESAYREAAERMASVVQAADESAAQLVHQAEEEAKRRLFEASERIAHTERESQAAAHRIQEHAEAEAGRIRDEAEEMLTMARMEVDRVLGSLDEKRSVVLEDFRVLRQRLAVIASAVDGVLAIPPPALPELATLQLTEGGAKAEEGEGGEGAELSDLIDLTSVEESIEVLHEAEIQDQGATRSPPRADGSAPL